MASKHTHLGSKNNGFFVLNNNMKHGYASTKELIEFLRESCTVEETYSKLLARLAKTAGNSSQDGTFGPFWNILKVLIEKLSSLQMQLVHTWSDLIKDMVRYYEEQHKRHKTMRENEQSTLELVHAVQQTTIALQKARELYHTRCMELERMKRDNASVKDTEKAEVKYKKALDEYKGLIDKYKDVRNDFEGKMVQSCHHFQELEEEHICQMKDFIDTFGRSWENEHAVLGQVHREFKQSCDEMTTQKLLNVFIERKGTGTEKPGPIEFVEPDLSSLMVNRPMSPEPNVDKKEVPVNEKSKQGESNQSSQASQSMQTLALVALCSEMYDFLSLCSARKLKEMTERSFYEISRVKLTKLPVFEKEEREEEKNNNKEKDEKDPEAVEPDNQHLNIDEEGYTIPPENPMDNNGDKNSWNSSDSDSDSDGEESRIRGIRVEIKPLDAAFSHNSGTVEDIKASVEVMRLSPTPGWKRSQTPVDKKMKRSHSALDTLDQSKPGQDLLKLDLLGPSSAGSTPTGANYNISLPSPLSAQTEIDWGGGNSSNAVSASATDSAAVKTNADETLAASPTLPGPPILSPASYNPSGLPPPVLSPASYNPSGLPPPVARPPSRSRGIIPAVHNQVKMNGPTPIGQSESNGNMAFTTTSMPVGSSRGPSPLTIGMSDSVPLAVAFTETINACFKGHDANSCVVYTTGNVMMSFPAGVVRVFTENPSPALLSFRIRNVNKWEEVVTNSSILSKDEAQSTQDVYTYEFNMFNLIDHLRQQGEQNKTASYFNIDILKYRVRSLPGVESTPLPLVAYWKCEENSIDFRLNYRYNPCAMSSPVTLKNVSVILLLDIEASKMQSIPEGIWEASMKRATWKLNDISEVSEQESQGCIRAKFDLDNGPSKPGATALQFAAEGATLSGADFELAGPGYRISLLKKRFSTGKYFVDPDQSASCV